MPTAEACEVVASGTVATIVGLLSSYAPYYGGLSSVAVVAIVVPISKPLGGGVRMNISCGGRGCAHRSATTFSLTFIRLGSKVC